MPPKYQIIFINGPSSSGKTVLAKALQESLHPPFLHSSIDQIIEMMPAYTNQWDKEGEALGFSWKKVENVEGEVSYEIQKGPFAEKMSRTFKEIVKTLARLDHNLIIDEVSFGQVGRELWEQALQGYSVLWVGVRASLEILEKREHARGDRKIGSAKRQSYTVHQGVTYDIEIDTTHLAVEEMVLLLREKMFS